MVVVNSLSFVAPFMAGCCYSSITHWVYAYSNCFRHDDGFTLTYSQAFPRSPKSGARNQGTVNCPHKDGAHDLDLTDQRFQPRELMFWTKQLKQEEGNIQKRTYLALSILLLQGRIEVMSSSLKNLDLANICHVPSSPRYPKINRWPWAKMFKDSMDLRDVTGANSCFSWLKKTFQSHPILPFHHPFFKNSWILSYILLCITWEKL